MAQHQLSDLVAERAGPCISLYFSTDRSGPERKQNVIRFRNQLREAELSLRASDAPLREHERDALLEPLQALAANERFWDHTLDALAVLRAPDFFKVYKLQRAVPTRTIVADSFHIKPLLRILQSADRFEVLAITRDHVRLFRGNRDALDEVDLDPSVPRSLTQALGEELTEPHEATRAIRVSSTAGRGTSVHYGSGSKSDEMDKDTERYFRIVDRAIVDTHDRPSAPPLVLAALPEYHAAFRAVSHNPHLMDGAIAGNPDALSADELRTRAWEIIAPSLEKRLQGLLDEYHAASPRALASDDIPNVAVAAIGGRVRTLLVDADRIVPGTVERATGHFTPWELDDPRTDDAVDDLAELTLRMGGDVVVVPSDRMPSETGVAAIYRF
jgi:hypothetical protein